MSPGLSARPRAHRAGATVAGPDDVGADDIGPNRTAGPARQTLVEVELDAGRELVGYATEYLAFQARFLADLIALPFAVVAAVSEAVGSFFAAAVAPAPVVEPSVPAEAVSVSTAPAVARFADSAVETVDAEPADTAATVEDVKAADEPKMPTRAVSAPNSDTDSDAVTTVSAQGEVRSGTTEAADTTDVDDPTSAARDEAPEDDESADEQRREPATEPADNDAADDAAQKDSSGEEG